MENNQSSLFGGKYDEEPWEEHWQDMPEFVQNDETPYKQVVVNFRNEEDYQNFGKLVEQTLTFKTKSLWFPKYDRCPPSNYLYKQTNES